jgi:hypothetical protein
VAELAQPAPGHLAVHLALGDRLRLWPGRNRNQRRHVNHAAATAAWDAWVVAVIVGVLSIAAISRLAVWEEWVNLVVGVWLFFSPWILGFAGLYSATWNSLIVGFLIAVLAVWGIMAARSVGTRVERVETETRP